MREKLLTLAILSIAGTIFFILGCIGFSGHHLVYRDNKFYNEWNDPAMETMTTIGFIFWALLVIAQFIVGVVTLATNSKHELQNHGMRVASGVIGLLGGILFVNAIVAGIAFANEPKTYKESKDPRGNLPVDVIDKINAQEMLALKQQVQDLKQENETLLAKQKNETPLAKQEVKTTKPKTKKKD